jgi:uncharacterized protein YecE (DUF72 family)
MMQPSLFPENDRPAQAARLAPMLKTLAAQGIYFGTSSWKYEGWLGSIYTTERYTTRGKFSFRKFEEECLAEYAETFPAVGGDFSFYQFPSPEYWGRLFGGSPKSLLFGLKVPEEITVANWPGHARYGARAGKPNTSFLDHRLFEAAFVRPLEPYRDRIATLMFEFGTFSKAVFPSAQVFCEQLDSFLGALPGGFRYAVETRNREYLGDEYFGMLARHRTAHVFNAWTRMPEIGAQARMAGSLTGEFIAGRALLRCGRTYENAVKQFEPYRTTQEVDPATRVALEHLAEEARKARMPVFLFVNNRLEGNAPSTIEAVASRLVS